MAVSREAVVQTAEKYVSRGKIEPAIREYRKLLAENPNDINTLNRVGDLYARIQRIDEAVDFFTQIAEQYTTEGFFVKAIAIYKKIIKLNPTRLEVYEKLAELYHKQGLVTEARTQYQVLADYYTKHENAASAIAIYQKMVELEPDNPSYHVRLAEIYQQQQLLEKAVGEYRIIAEMMISHGRSQEAAQVYERALAVDSGNSAFITDAVMKLRAAGNAAAAVRFLAIATERSPQAAARVARLAGLDEEKPKAPEPAPAPPPPRQAAAPAPAAPAPAAREVPPPQPVQPAAPHQPAPPPPAPEPEPEVEVELEAELIPGIDFPLQDWRTFPELFETSAPSQEAEPQELSTFTGQLEEVETEAPVKAWASSPSPATAPPESDEIDLNLDEVFVLDIDDEEDEPSSLVKPPPDMLAGGKGQAWAQEPEEPSRLAAWPEPAGSEAEETPPALLEMDLDLAPLEGLEPAGAGPRPSLEESCGIDFDESLLELEIEEPALPPAGGSPWVQIEDMSDLPQLDAPAWTVEPEVEAAAPALPAEPVSEVLQIDADVLERTAAELHPQELARDEDLVSEAEVLAKYGLEDKALERLREALRLRPDNLGAYAQMIHIHLGKGDEARVIELARQMSGIVARTGDRGEVWAKLRRQLTVTGYRFDGDRLVAAPGEPELAAPPAAPSPAAAPPPAAPRRRPAGPDVDQMLQGILGEKPVRTPRTPAPQPPAAALPPPASAPASAAAASAPPAPAALARPAVFNPLEIGEMIEREMWGEEVEPASAAPAPEAQPPARGLDDSGSLSWLDEADRGRDVPEPAKKSAGLFDEEDDFFDLAAELEEELTAEGVLQGGDLLAQPTEQSLEEIVEGFKKGVAEHLSPTDYDTHFNLGIAYREMGLLDEAIGEFQLASKDPSHLVLCCSMLGLCFLDKGLPELAVKWYRRGLEAPGLAEEDNLGLLYDLGCAYLAAGDEGSAYQTFVELYGINTNYRDVVARIEELGRR